MLRCKFRYKLSDTALHYDTSRIDTELFVSGAAPRLTNDYISSTGIINGTFTAIGGVIVPNFPTFGGYTIAGNGSATTLLLADVLVESTTIHINGPLTVAGAYFAGAPDLDSYPGTLFLINGAIGASVGYTANAQWGPGSLNAKNGAQVWTDNATTSMLLTGGYAIDGATTAWSFSGTTYTSGVTVSSTNVASNGALMNPKTNSRISSGFAD